MTGNHDNEVAAFILALMRLKGIGPKTVVGFLNEAVPHIETASRLDADFMLSLETTGSSKASVIVRALRKSPETWEELEDAAFETIEIARTQGVDVLHPLMPSYPKRLLRNQSHPPILYCKGKLDSLNPEKAVAIVGTRTPTEFGRRMGRRLAQLLSEDGYVIVSGLAVGCDTAGHEGALDARGQTVAVLPTPVDAPVYPRQNQELADRIVEMGGALVSEYAPGTEQTDRQLVGNLIARDEWQPALADGIVAIETTVGGGTRHAMEHALRTGVPTAVFDYSSRKTVDFYGDPSFGGNVEYLKMTDKVSPIFEPQTVEEFKERMDSFRLSKGDGAIGSASVGGCDSLRLFE